MGVLSTEDEHHCGVDRAKTSYPWLISEVGISRDSLIVCDAGNGSHVFIAIDIPNQYDVTALIRDCPAALGLQFGNDRISVDQSVGDASQITKVYPTNTGKGDDTAERPHRFSCDIVFPELVKAGTFGQIQFS